MDLILVLIQLPAALMVMYLVTLSVAAMVPTTTLSAATDRRRFALLIPAHNEEVLLPRLLDSIAHLDYPQHLYSVHLVADNCTDSTPEIGSDLGAIVHERHNQHLRGKGYALQWLLARVRGSYERCDAYVILDADSVVSSNFLEVMNRHLARGDVVIQSYYGVLNQQESWTSGLRFAALALFNHLRPRGRDALGLSVGLRGNGMCFASSVLDRLGWNAFTLAEDAELHVQLVEAGITVRYAAETAVLAEMPASFRGARDQNVRWERGRLHMLRASGPRLLIQGIRLRDPAALDALAEQVVPPLSVLVGITTLTLLVMALLRVSGPLWLASAVFAGEIFYVAVGLRLVRARPATYLGLVAAPIYIAWKLWIYTLAALNMSDSRWIRTARSSQDS